MVSYDGDSWALAVPSVTVLHHAATLTPLCVQTPLLPASSSEDVQDFGRRTTHPPIRYTWDTLALQRGREIATNTLCPLLGAKSSSRCYQSIPNTLCLQEPSAYSSSKTAPPGSAFPPNSTNRANHRCWNQPTKGEYLNSQEALEQRPTCWSLKLNLSWLSKLDLLKPESPVPSVLTGSRLHFTVVQNQESPSLLH